MNLRGEGLLDSLNLRRGEANLSQGTERTAVNRELILSLDYGRAPPYFGGCRHKLDMQRF